MVVTFVVGGGAGAGAAAVADGGGGRCHAEDPGNGSRRCPIQGPVLLQRCTTLPPGTRLHLQLLRPRRETGSWQFQFLQKSGKPKPGFGDDSAGPKQRVHTEGFLR